MNKIIMLQSRGIVILFISLLLHGVATAQTVVRFEIEDYTDLSPRITVGFKNYFVQIDSLSGKGECVVNTDKPVYASVQIRKYDTRLLYLEPNKDLELHYSQNEKNKEVSYKGSLGKENDFINREKFYSSLAVPIRDVNLQKFVIQTDSILELNKRRLDSLSFSSVFKDMETKRLWVNATSLLLRLSIVKIDTVGYLQVLTERLIEDPSLLVIPAYEVLLEQYVRKLVVLKKFKGRHWEGDEITDEVTDKKVECILSIFKNEDIISHMMDVTLFRYGGLQIQCYKDLYRQYVKNEERLALFNEACRKSEKLVPGKPFQDFEFLSNKGEKVKLSDLKGKYVYLDIWASWCGPCKGEMPSLLELEKRFEGKDIVFVSLSIDRNKDIEVWKQTIEQMGLGGIQLHFGEDWEWLKQIMPTTISVPRFILLDREGKILNIDMSRPSNKETAEALEKLL